MKTFKKFTDVNNGELYIFLCSFNGPICITNLPKTVAKNNCNWFSTFHSFCGSRIQEGLCGAVLTCGFSQLETDGWRQVAGEGLEERGLGRS